MLIQNLRTLQRFIVRRSYNFNWKSVGDVVRRRVTNFQPVKPYFFMFSLVALPFQKQSEEEKPATPKVAAGKLSEVVQHADQLYDENNIEELIKLLKNYPDPEQYDIKWRLARALYALSKTVADAKENKELVNEAFVKIQEALVLKDDDFAAHKWMAILLDKKSGLDGLKVRIGQLENVKRHMERAVELNPQDPTSWYILGEFALGLAEINWVTLKIVNTLFASPPRGTYEEALSYFKKAEETQPDFYSMNYLMLGKCYLGLNNKEQAKEWLTKASEVTVKNDDDKKCKEEALKLLKKV